MAVPPTRSGSPRVAVQASLTIRSGYIMLASNDRSPHLGADESMATAYPIQATLTVEDPVTYAVHRMLDGRPNPSPHGRVLLSNEDDIRVAWASVDGSSSTDKDVAWVMANISSQPKTQRTMILPEQCDVDTAKAEVVKASVADHECVFVSVAGEWTVYGWWNPTEAKPYVNCG